MLVLILTVALLIFYVLIEHSSGWLRIFPFYPVKHGEGLIFTHGRSEKAILMFHEFSGRPESLRHWAKRFYKKGWDVYVPALQRREVRGANGETQNAPLYNDWKNQSLELVARRRKKYRCLVLLGCSLGGTMALEAASEIKVDAVVTVPAPVTLKGSHFRKPFLRNGMLWVTGVLSLFREGFRTGKMPEHGKSRLIIQKKDGWLSIRSVHSQKCGLRALRRKLCRVSCPVLTLQGEKDRTVDKVNMTLILTGCNASQHELYVVSLREDGTRRHLLWLNKADEMGLYRRIETFVENLRLSDDEE